MDRDRSPGFLVVILLAMFGVYYSKVEMGQNAGQVETVAKAEVEKKGAGSERPKAIVSEGQCLEGSEPVRFLCRFFGDSSIQAPRDPKGGWASMPWVGLVRNQVDMKQVVFLVATVPDPDMTRLSLYFDRGTASIQAAVASVSWRFDRAWLPWKPAAAAAGQGLLPEDEIAERQPGLMLFRGGTGEAAVVFLIGESPVAGIRRQAFREAMAIIEGLSGHPPAQVRIAGPNFSGAYPSLRQEIDAVACDPKWKTEFRVISPNSTVKDAQDQFSQVPGVGTVRLSRILARDESALTAFNSYLTSHWGSDIRSAFIAEGETVYGLQTPTSGRTFNFPREIALLRNLYPEAARHTFGSGAQQKSGSADLKLRSGGRPTLPVFAEQQTVTSYEAQLLQIAQALDRDDFEIAGLAATDVLDMIYVAGYLRRAAPETRLYLLDADLLLVRATDSYALDGTMLLTDFPLVLENRLWTGWMDRTPYSSRWEMATFNAVRALLLEDNPKPGPLLEYGDPFQPTATHPPVWLTIVSHDALWPIATFSESDDKLRLEWPANAAPWDDRLKVAKPSLGWEIFTIILSLAGLAFVGVLATACSRKARRAAEGLESYCFDGCGPGKAGRTYYVLVIAILLCGLILAQITPVLAVEKFRRDFLLQLVMPALALTALVFAAIRVLLKGGPSFLSNPDPGEVETIELRKAFFKLSVAALVGFVFYLVLWSICFLWTSKEARGEVYFRAYRSMDLLSGVSPVLPLQILGVSLLLLMFMHFRRYVLFVREHPFLPKVGADPFLKRLDREEDPILRLVSWPFLGIKDAPFIFLGALVIPLSLGGPQSLENYSYDLLYTATLVLAIVLSMQVWLRFLLTWRELRRVLEALESHPFRETFNTLPPEFSDVPLFGSANRYQAHIVFCRSLDILRALESHGMAPQEIYGTAESQVPELERKLAYYLGPDVDVPEGAMASHRSLDNEFCKVSGNLLAALRPYWQGGRSAREGEGHSLATPTQIRLAEEYIALRYVSIVRYVMLHLRNLMMFVAGGFFFTSISSLLYPFRSQAVLGWVATASLVVLGLPVALTLLEMDRNPLLIRLRSKDGSTGGARYLLRASIYAVPALLALAGAHFPGLSRFFGSWMAPALQALSK